MNKEQRRLLEMAGILRRGTPDHLLLEGDDEGGGDDLFGGDDEGGDDAGGDDLFGDDAGGGEEGGDDAEGGGEEEEGSNRVPPEDLKPADIEQFGSPRFLDVEQKITNMFNNCMTSASVGAQELESYPGNAIKPTPAKDDTPEEEPAGDEEVEETEEGEGEEEEGEDKNESFYRYGNRRDKWLINEAMRLLTEAEDEGAATDEFDMERFCTELANYMDTIHNTEDIEAGIFNSARQMILNNFGKDTENEFVDMLGAVTDGQWSFLQTGFEGAPDAPIAVGAGKDAGGAQMSDKDAKTRYYTDKSIHIKTTLAQHAAFKKHLADFGLGMREVLLECIERICDPNNSYMQELLNECVENKFLPRNRITLEGDVENLYRLIEEGGDTRTEESGDAGEE